MKKAIYYAVCVTDGGSEVSPVSERLDVADEDAAREMWEADERGAWDSGLTDAEDDLGMHWDGADAARVSRDMRRAGYVDIGALDDPEHGCWTLWSKDAGMEEVKEAGSMGDVFGPVIYGYSRAQAIEDGELVDVTEADGCKGNFRFPVALTRAAWAACVEAGGSWGRGEINPKDNFCCIENEVLTLPGGQSVAGRLHDVCWMLRQTMRLPGLDAAQRNNTAGARVFFSVLVDAQGDGHPTRVELWSLCGPGDTAEPCITIMLRGED